MITSLTAHWGHDKVLQGLHLRKDTSGKRQCICICCIQWRVDVGSFILTSSMQMQLHRLRQSCLSNKMVYIYKFINLQNSSNSWLQCGNQASPELKPVHAHPAQLCLTCRCCQSFEMCFCYLHLHKSMQSGIWRNKSSSLALRAVFAVNHSSGLREMHESLRVFVSLSLLVLLYIIQNAHLWDAFTCPIRKSSWDLKRQQKQQACRIYKAFTWSANPFQHQSN